MSNKYEYNEDMVAKIHETLDGVDVTEEHIQGFVDEFGFPRRSVAAKLRKMGFDVPTKEKAAPRFSAEETAALIDFLNDNKGEMTSEQVSKAFADGKFTPAQINGKLLSLELTDAVLPAEKKVTPKKFSEEEEATIAEMVESGAFIEDIAAALGKEVPTIRGKLLSMKLSAPQKVKKEATTKDAYEGIEEMAENMTVEQLAEHFGKTTRGVKTVLSRRGLAASDYTPKEKKE